VSKLIFACPSYGPLEPKAIISHRTAIMHPAAHGHEWIGDCSPNRSGWTTARNEIVKQALDTEADYVCWADSDVVLPPYAYTQLLKRGDDFVTGIYFQRYPPHFPLIAHYLEERDTFSWFVEWPDNTVAPIDGCGFGCIITSTAMLRKMAAPWFQYEKFSEDFDFCRKAATLGYQLYVHTGVICEHLADPVGAGVDDFRREYAKVKDKPVIMRPDNSAVA
jgi:hypothetical protein